jgi:cation:H+ antiporter
MLPVIYLLGVALVLVAANRLVVVCVGITRTWGVRSLVLGSTLVATATSLPEFTVVLIAVLAGKADLAVGNILGSNILNIGLVLGLSCLLRPMAVSSTARRRELPLALGVLALFFLLAMDRKVGRPGGILMLLLMAGYLSLHIRTAAGDIRAFQLNRIGGEVPASWRGTLLRTSVAVAVLFAGGLLMVLTASRIAQALGISQLTIGTILVALSTSLPELSASVASIYHRQPDISLANVIGSNNFNILVCVGLVAALKPISVSPAALRMEFPAAFVFYLILLGLLFRHKDLARRQGLILLASYGIFVAWLFFR